MNWISNYKELIQIVSTWGKYGIASKLNTVLETLQEPLPTEQSLPNGYSFTKIPEKYGFGLSFSIQGEDFI